MNSLMFLIMNEELVGVGKSSFLELLTTFGSTTSHNDKTFDSPSQFHVAVRLCYKENTTADRFMTLLDVNLAPGDSCFSRIQQCRCSYTLNIRLAHGVRGVHGVTGISGCVYMDQVESPCSLPTAPWKTTAATSPATANATVQQWG